MYDGRVVPIPDERHTHLDVLQTRRGDAAAAVYEGITPGATGGPLLQLPGLVREAPVERRLARRRHARQRRGAEGIAVVVGQLVAALGVVPGQVDARAAERLLAAFVLAVGDAAAPGHALVGQALVQRLWKNDLDVGRLGDHMRRLEAALDDRQRRVGEARPQVVHESGIG